MKNLLRSTLAIAIGLSLAACGSSSNKGNSTVEFGGEFVKGKYLFADVELFHASDTGFTNALAATMTDNQGAYVLPYTGVIEGAYVVRATTGENTTMICDAHPCGDTAYGSPIPTDQLTGLELTTINVPGDNLTVTANGNAVTTIATQTVIAGIEGTGGFNLDTIELAVMTQLQINASAAIGALAGIDLTGVNIFSTAIVDASDSTAMLATSGASSSLSLFNGSLAGLAGTGENIGTKLKTYVGKVKTAAVTVFVSNSNLDYPTLIAEIRDINADIIIEINKILLAINTGVSVEDQLDNSTVPDPIVVTDVIDQIKETKKLNPITGITGVTGAT